VERRDFLKTSALAAGVSLLEACGRREVQYLVQPLERQPGRPGTSVWRNSVCGQCPAGCGTRVRLVDGDARKVEGLSGHPVNHGGLCALGQASLQGHYNPDRIASPKKRRGARGSGEWEDISWEEALEQAAGAIAAAPDPASVLMLSGRSDPFVDALLDRLAGALGAPQPIAVEAPEIEIERRAAALVPGFGKGALPAYDLARSDYVLSIGPAFLDRGPQPAHSTWAINQSRAGRAGHRGKLVQAEARMSQTAAYADEWLPVVPGTEGTLARAIGGVLLAEGLVRQPDPEIVKWDPEPAAIYQALFADTAPTPEAAAEICGIAADRIHRIARELAAAEQPVVLGGGSAALNGNGLYNTVAALALNLLIDGVLRPGGAMSSVSPSLARTLRPENAPRVAIGDREQQLEAGALPTVVLACEADPVHTRPRSRGWREALEAAETVIVLGSFHDDTAVVADLILPLHSDIERFQAIEAPALPYPVLSVATPAVPPLGDSRHPGDIVLALAHALDHEALFPWSSFDAAVRETAQAAWEQSSPEIDTSGYWSQANDAGWWGGGPAGGRLDWGGTPNAVATPAPPPAAGADEFTLVLFESAKYGDGRGANRPWLQELPDTLTTAMWSFWAEIATADARRVGLETGDLIELESPHGKIEVPAIVRPEARPGTVSLPLGGGYADFGRYARGRGHNALDLVGPESVEGCSEPALTGGRVKLRRLGVADIAIFGRGLRDAEHIPTGWAPMEHGGHDV
jgi:anaerobic selenocysteine-containing dehydrogenase